MPRIEALILDFDGVVVESLEIKARAFADLFADHPEHVPAIVAHHHRHPGVSRYVKFEHIYQHMLGQPLSDAEVRRLDRRFSALVRDAVVACPFVKGALPFLRWASARVPVYVASATPEREMKWIVRKRELTPYFKGVFGSPATKADAVRQVAGKLKIDPRAMLFVGDATADRDAAKATGARFVARVPPGGRIFARPYVRDLSELHALLRSERAALHL